MEWVNLVWQKSAFSKPLVVLGFDIAKSKTIIKSDYYVIVAFETCLFINNLAFKP